MTYGLDLKREKEEVAETDWVFGSTSPWCLAMIAEDKREQYLPAGEKQRGKDDFMDCASRSPINILETKFNYLLNRSLMSKENRTWLAENGYVTESGVEFSDRFIAINSKTTRQGNSLKAPLEAIRKHGLIPKHKLPALSTMLWSDYHNETKITKQMRELGQEFRKRFVINYERVYEPEFSTLLGHDMLDVAGYGWPKPVNGTYPRVNYKPNHAFMAIKNAFFVFDNYLDTDNDWIKHLARDYNFLDYGYRIFIAEERVPSKQSWFASLYSYLSSFLL